MQKLQGIKTTMFFPYLGLEEEWTLVGYGDAGVKSLPDKLSSCGGQVIMMVNKHKKKVCIINWIMHAFFLCGRWSALWRRRLTCSWQ